MTAVNYIVDPYMLFQVQRISSFNDKKPAAANRSALYKPYNVININPKTIIVGNSRPEMGLNPESNCWPENNGEIYNLTFPGVGFYGQIRALFHAVEGADNIENILLAIDFADFLYKRRLVKEVVWPKQHSSFLGRLLVDEELRENKGYFLNKVQDYSMALFSLDALNDSIYTILAQDEYSTDRTALGFNPAKDYQKMIRYEGPWILFEQKRNDLERRFAKEGMSIYDSGEWSLELEAIKRVIEMAAKKEIKLTLFINPYHYSYLEIIRSSGYWNEFESFKKNIQKAVKKYGQERVKFWDFSIYSAYTVTLTPKKDIKSSGNRWFWEPAHYKKELGDLMLESIFGKSCNKYKAKDVGVNLNNITTDNHNKHQAEVRLKLLSEI